MLEDVFLFQLALNVLLVGSFAGLLMGAVLIVRPHWLKRLSQTLNREIASSSLNRRIKFDPWFYRYRYLSGGLIFFGALYVLIFFTVLLERSRAVEALVQRWQASPALIDALFDPLVLILILGACLALFISLFILFRPSLLREFEQGANQWISLRKTLPESAKVDEFTLRYAQQVGVFLLLGSLYTWILLIYWAKAF
jgi:hypothetical protein